MSRTLEEWHQYLDDWSDEVNRDRGLQALERVEDEDLRKELKHLIYEIEAL